MQNAEKNESTTNNSESTRQAKPASSPARQTNGKVKPPAPATKRKSEPAADMAPTKTSSTQTSKTRVRSASGKQMQAKPAATKRIITTSQPAIPRPATSTSQPTAKAEGEATITPTDVASTTSENSSTPNKAPQQSPLSTNLLAAAEQPSNSAEPDPQPIDEGSQDKAPQQATAPQPEPTPQQALVPQQATALEPGPAPQKQASRTTSIPQVEPASTANTTPAPEATPQATTNMASEGEAGSTAAASNQPKLQPANIARGVTSKVAKLTRMIKAQPSNTNSDTAQDANRQQNKAPSSSTTPEQGSTSTQPEPPIPNATAATPEPASPDASTSEPEPPSTYTAALEPDATAPEPAAHFSNGSPDPSDESSFGSAIKAGAEALGDAAKAITDTTTVLVENLPLPAIEDVPGALTLKERLADAKDWFTIHFRSPLGIALLVVVAIYVVGSLFFSSHFLPGTTINGTNMSLRSTKAALAIAQNDEENGYSAQVDGDGLDLLLKGQDINFAVDTDAYTQGVQEYLPSWAWPVYLFQQRDYQVSDGVSYDTRKLEKILSPAIEAANQNTTPPENATIVFDSSKDSFVAKEENSGTSVSLKNTTDTVSRGVSTLQEHIELGKSELTQPSISAESEQMQQAIEKANKLKDAEIDLTVKGKTAATASPELIRSWLMVDEAYNVVGNVDLITEWTRGELSAQVDTVGTARTYTRTSDGKRIEVFGGTYGWNVDGVALAELIAKQLAEESLESIEIPMQSKAEVYIHGRQDWGPRYLDVDLTEQYVCFFDKDSNIIMESECVSGNISENNETVTGVFTIESKASPMTLIGLDENGDGEPDYENEVDYWMPFYGGYGLHDALWRNYFGGQAYLYDGSHGCVNLPYYAAAQLYELIDVGDVVVVHF